MCPIDKRIKYYTDRFMREKSMLRNLTGGKRKAHARYCAHIEKTLFTLYTIRTERAFQIEQKLSNCYLAILPEQSEHGLNERNLA